jgi:hypothetical protein
VGSEQWTVYRRHGQVGMGKFAVDSGHLAVYSVQKNFFFSIDNCSVLGVGYCTSYRSLFLIF